jgi:adenylate cyclase
MLKKIYFLLVPILVSAFCSLLFLTNLDGQVYDLYLRTLPSLKEDQKILIIKVDDGAIENVGIFPWTRDILADAIVFLREMGALTVAFDLSYLDNSPVRVDPDYVQNELPRYIDNGFMRINETAGQVIDGFAQGNFGRRDAEDIKTSLAEINDSIKSELEVSIGYITRDVDAHFANTLQFFGNSYLTLTMIQAEDILGDDKSFEMDPEIQIWLENHIALENITVINDTLTPEAPGIIPAIFKLISRADGAGFVNAIPDSDGYRRRVHLLMKHNGLYYPHLILASMAEMLGSPGIEVSNTRIVLKNANLGGVTKDIIIPRTEDGTVLVKWPKKQFSEYNTMSSWDLIRYNRIEADLIYNLGIMDESNFFAYWEGDETPNEKYNNANYIKEILYQGENAEEGITFDTYLEYRQDYLYAADTFLNGQYEDAILADVGDDGEVQEYVRSLFKTARDQFSQLMEIRGAVSAKTTGSLSIIGVDATSMTDLGLTTFQENFPNVGLYAALANMLLAEEFIDDSPKYISLLIALFLSLVLSLIIKRLHVGNSIILGMAAIVFTAAALTVVFVITKRYVGTVVPFAAVTLTFLSLTGINFFTTIREKSFLRSAFSRYLAPEVINQIIEDPSKLNLGGEKLEMTAIFTDIRSFSTISEALKDPKSLVDLLNHYLTWMSDIILENQGTVDKYEGDAIIAFFGAPIHIPDHAVRACRSAVLMKKAEAEINKEAMELGLITLEVIEALVHKNIIKAGDTEPIYTRIGINTGDMVVGNMGTPNKMNYTIMGDSVNLAARLEGVNKQYNTGGILISEHTRKQIGDEFVVRNLGLATVVGIKTPLRLYELLDFNAQASQEILDMNRNWDAAVAAYEERKFAEALGIFQGVREKFPDDNVASLFVGWCEGYLKNPPPDGWGGVNNLTEK